VPNKLLVTVTLKDRVLKQYSFDRVGAKIGRHRACDIVLDNPAVSRLHAEIKYENGSMVLHDKGSSNGVLVNGQQVQQHELQDSDVLTIGKFTLYVGAPDDRSSGSSGNALSGRDLTIRTPERQ
jgi:pSer/pThr/pTyr-binding forkhead associated (FHA) protein